jgi:hypothetical protein
MAFLDGLSIRRFSVHTQRSMWGSRGRGGRGGERWWKVRRKLLGLSALAPLLLVCTLTKPLGVCVCVCVCVCMSVCVYACAINIHAHTGVQGHSGLCTCASEAVRRGAVLYLPPTLQRPFPIVRQACEIICTSLPPSNPYSLSYPTPLLFSPSLSSSLPPSLPPSLPSSPLDPHGSSV